jgi:hypothetical protein
MYRYVYTQIFMIIYVSINYFYIQTGHICIYTNLYVYIKFDGKIDSDDETDRERNGRCVYTYLNMYIFISPKF